MLAFLLPLFLVELVFQINSKTHFIGTGKKQNPFAVINPEGALEPPKEVIELIREKYQKPQPNFDIARELDTFREFNDRSGAPIPAYKYISENSIKGENNFTIRDTIFNKKFNRSIFDEKYVFDENKFRKIPDQKINSSKKNLLLLGCSVAFGIGVAQGQDMGSKLKAEFPDYNVYNMGRPAGGMGDFLGEITSADRVKSISNNGGFVVCVMIYPHIARTFCDMDCHVEPTSWMRYGNVYDFDDQGSLVSLGSYQKAHPFLFSIREVLGKSEFLKYVGYGLSGYRDTDQTDKYIEYMKYLKKFYSAKNLNFYVYLPTIDRNFNQEFFKKLHEENFEVFYYKRPVELLDKNILEIIGDGHYTEAGNEYHAKLMADHLKSLSVK